MIASRTAMQVKWPAVITYFALTFVALGGDRAPFGRDHPTLLAWALSKVALPVVLSVLALSVASRSPDAAALLGIRRPPRRYVALAVLAGLPSLLVVTGHA